MYDIAELRPYSLSQLLYERGRVCAGWGQNQIFAWIGGDGSEIGRKWLERHNRKSSCNSRRVDAEANSEGLVRDQEGVHSGRVWEEASPERIVLLEMASFW